MTPNHGFWSQLPRPCFVLAPMAGVTDAAFRPIIAQYGKPHAMFTEFTSTDGLCSAGRGNLLIDLMYCEPERPIVAQIFGNKPDNFARTAELCAELGFDGIDINCGCPDRNVEKQGAGSQLIRSPELICELVRACRRGAPGMPISVKTRMGYEENIATELVKRLLECEPAAITMHLRTRQEMSKVPARWHDAAPIVEVVRESGLPTRILGNGDVTSLPQAEALCAETGMDGVMIGRGIYGNPWLFNRAVGHLPPHWTDKLKVMLEHTKRYMAVFGEHKHFGVMKKHYKGYVTDFPGAKELRVEVMEHARNVDDVEAALVAYFSANGEDLYAPLSPDRQPIASPFPVPAPPAS